MLAAPHPSSPVSNAVKHDLPSVVLDTNVVLDWLVFRDPTCDALAAQLHARQLVWHATPPMRAELVSVLPRLLGWDPDCKHVLAMFDLLAHPPLGEPASTLGPAPRCRDGDDQKFIDTAVAVGARWLFTRDRALLDLAKPALAVGVEIVRPTDWRHRAMQGHASTACSEA